MTIIATILRCTEHLTFSETGIFGQPLMVARMKVVRFCVLILGFFWPIFR